MRTWAFATSPYGLNLPEARFWRLTPREIAALSDRWRNHLLGWAIERADYRNAHIDPEKTEPYLADDFMPGGDRETRIAKAKSEKLLASLANMQLATTVKPGADSAEVPDWAKGSYHGDR